LPGKYNIGRERFQHLSGGADAISRITESAERRVSGWNLGEMHPHCLFLMATNKINIHPSAAHEHTSKMEYNAHDAWVKNKRP